MADQFATLAVTAHFTLEDGTTIVFSPSEPMPAWAAEHLPADAWTDGKAPTEGELLDDPAPGTVDSVVVFSSD